MVPCLNDVDGDEHEYEYENDVINDANVFAVDDYYYSDGSAENTEFVIYSEALIICCYYRKSYRTC